MTSRSSSAVKRNRSLGPASSVSLVVLGLLGFGSLDCHSGFGSLDTEARVRVELADITKAGQRFAPLPLKFLSLIHISEPTRPY